MRSIVLNYKWARARKLARLRQEELRRLIRVESVFDELTGKTTTTIWMGGLDTKITVKDLSDVKKTLRLLRRDNRHNIDYNKL